MYSSIEQIRQINRRRKQLREQANRQVFRICMEKIKLFAYRGVQALEYEVPVRFANNPYYNRDDCREYLVGRLGSEFSVRSRGYLLTIDWSGLI